MKMFFFSQYIHMNIFLINIVTNNKRDIIRYGDDNLVHRCAIFHCQSSIEVVLMIHNVIICHLFANPPPSPWTDDVINGQPLRRGSVLGVQQVNVETMVSPIACGLMSCFPNSNKEAPFQSGFRKFLKIKSSQNARSCTENVNLTGRGNFLNMSI